ncbi:MAG: hypothetical protein ACREXR_17030 [Gammaproteobacteria bacterium]
MKTNRYLFLALALFVGLSPPTAHANAYPMKRVSKDKPETVEPLSVRYVNGLLNARIRGARLGQVLRQLGVATGARFTLIDPATEAQPVFAQVGALPFTEGVTRILDGFSYAIYPLEGSHMPAVTVLSRPHALRPKTSTATAEQPSTVYPVQQRSVPPPPFAETYPAAMPDDASEPQLETLQ